MRQNKAASDIIHEYFEGIKSNQKSPMNPEEIRDKIWLNYVEDGDQALSNAQYCKFDRELEQEKKANPEIIYH